MLQEVLTAASSGKGSGESWQAVKSTTWRRPKAATVEAVTRDRSTERI
jgi:hypothetical protein